MSKRSGCCHILVILPLNIAFRLFELYQHQNNLEIVILNQTEYYHQSYIYVYLVSPGE